jgi:hypothetical protein
MKIFTVNGNNYRLPNDLNSFQQDFYIHLINWKWQHISKEAGTAGKEKYDAILPDSLPRNGVSPLVFKGIADTLQVHRSKNDFRTHLHFYHMASSQAANINLFLPILHRPAADRILRAIKPDFASLATKELDNGYCIEFWGGNFQNSSNNSVNAGHLGDKAKTSGTDSDIAIAYHNHAGELCLWLIEHKLTEKEFTDCGGFKSRGRKPRHDCSKSFSDILKNKSTCYYHDVRKFKYWVLTDEHRGFFMNHEAHSKCPFRGGMNQLWRNQLLGLAIEHDPQEPYKHVYFSVVKHPGNTALDNTLDKYRELIGNNPKFSVFTSADIIRAADQHTDPELADWINWYKDLYKPC